MQDVECAQDEGCFLLDYEYVEAGCKGFDIGLVSFFLAPFFPNPDYF
jgi:hypothetical protein